MDLKGIEVDRVVNIELADEIIVERLSGRRVCISGPQDKGGDLQNNLVLHWLHTGGTACREGGAGM